jgi:hypothetical protein
LFYFLAVYFVPIPIGLLLGNILSRAHIFFGKVVHSALIYVIFAGFSSLATCLVWMILSLISSPSTVTAKSIVFFSALSFLFFCNVWYWYRYPVIFSCEQAFLAKMETCPECKEGTILKFKAPKEKSGLLDQLLQELVVFHLIPELLSYLEINKINFQCDSCQTFFTPKQLTNYVVSKELDTPRRSA